MRTLDDHLTEYAIDHIDWPDTPDELDDYLRKHSMATVYVDQPDEEAKQLATTTTNIETLAHRLEINSEATLNEGGALLKDIKTFRQRITDLLGDAIKKAHATHKALTTQRKKLDGPLDNAERIIKGKVSTYQLAEQRRLNEERERLAAEARKAEETKRLAHAEALADAGDNAGADRVLDQPLVVAPVPVVAAPKVEGVSVRERWTYRIVDEALIPRNYLTVDEKRLGQLARSTKGTVNVPGVEFYNAASVAVSI
jgi:hypothetical protein